MESEKGQKERVRTWGMKGGDYTRGEGEHEEKYLREGSVKESETHPHSSVKQPGQSTSNFLWSDWSIVVVITGKCSEP